MASIAPGGAWAVAVRSRRTSILGGLTQLSPSEVATPGLIGSVNLVAWNRDGSYALLYSAPGNQLQRVRFTSGGPSVETPLDLSAWGKATALAIDPTGQKLAFAIAGSGLFLATGGQSPVAVATGQFAVIAFDDTGARLYAADLVQQQIVALDPSGTAVPFVSFAATNGAAANPVGLGVSAGGRYLMLADSARPSVLVYDIASQSLANTIPLASAPSRMEALSSGPAFLLNGANPKESLLILDGRDTPNVYFVPAGGATNQ